MRAILLHVFLSPRDECLCPVASTFQTNTLLENLGCKCQQTSFNFMGHLHWCSGMTLLNTHHFSDWPCSSENMQLKGISSFLQLEARVMRKSPAPSSAADTCCTWAATSARFLLPGDIYTSCETGLIAHLYRFVPNQVLEFSFRLIFNKKLPRKNFVSLRVAGVTGCL